MVADNPLKPRAPGTANKLPETSPTRAVECISLTNGSIKSCTLISGSRVLNAFDSLLLLLAPPPAPSVQVSLSLITKPCNQIQILVFRKFRSVSKQKFQFCLAQTLFLFCPLSSYTSSPQPSRYHLLSSITLASLLAFPNTLDSLFLLLLVLKGGGWVGACCMSFPKELHSFHHDVRGKTLDSLSLSSCRCHKQHKPPKTHNEKKQTKVQ